MKDRKILICIEGPDFSGKSTFLKRFKAETKHKEILYTKEPGFFCDESMKLINDKTNLYWGDENEQLIQYNQLDFLLELEKNQRTNTILRNEVLFNNAYDMEARLDIMCRARRVNVSAMQSLYARGFDVILTDRFYASSYVYQGLEIKSDLIDIYNYRGVVQILNNDQIEVYTIIFDVDYDTYLERKKTRDNLDSIETLTQDKARDIIYGYKAYMPKSRREKVIFIDANKTEDEVFESVNTIINNIIRGDQNHDN